LTPFLNLSLKASRDTREALSQLHQGLASLEHLEVPKVDGASDRVIAPSAKTLQSTLSLEGHRTVVLLDRAGASLPDNFSATIAAFGPTTLISVAEGQHLPCASIVQQHVAIQGGPDALLQHIKRSTILDGVADVVFSYHSGDADKHTNLRLANKLLTPGGCYVEIFTDPRTPYEKQVVIYYSRDEVREITEALRPSVGKIVSQLLQALNSLVPATVGRFFSGDRALNT
jgi:hypothetical protein